MRKFSDESAKEHADRLKTKGHRKPLRSFKELCAEFGVEKKTLMGYMGTLKGPKPVINGQSFRSKNMWYDPDEFRAWWKEVKRKLESPTYKEYLRKAKAPKEYKPTEVFRLQQWLRECGGATWAQIREAGFKGVYGGATSRMIAYGALRREGALFIATDVDYKPTRRKHKNESRRDTSL
jgi:hypothetical protein